MMSPSSSELTSDLSSDLSSIGSLSPPPEYLTPPSSQELISSDTQKLPQKRPANDEDTPPAKKRKTAEPKPRTTQYLNLGASRQILATDQKVQLDTLLKILRKRQKIVVVAGAGISVSAGIPDFRSDTGLFKTLKEEHKLKASGKHLFDASVYQTDASTSSFHDMVRGLSEQASAAKPTAFHHMLAKLASEGRLMRLYTQNVDGIETSMPPLETRVPLGNKGPWPRTVQLHGGLEKMVCSKCHSISEFQPALFSGSEAPPCNVCVETDKIRTDHAGKRSHGIGRLRPRIVLYNEHNPDQEAIGTVMEADLRTRPDAIIVVGTSMKIPGVKRFVREACGIVRDRRDGLAVWINRDPPPVGKEFENCWDLVVEGDCDKVASHANMKHWDDTSVDYQECTESEVERAKAKSSEIKVVIESQVKKAVRSALLTPAPSPRSKSAELEYHRKISLKLKPPKPPNLGNLDIKSSESLKTTIKLTSKLEASKSIPTKALETRGLRVGTSKKPVRKAAKAKKASKTPLLNVKINQAFRVSKPQAPKSRKQKTPILSDDELSPRAMAPISPSAARNNGPVHKESPTKPLFPNLLRSPSRPSIENIHLPVTASPPTSPRKALFPNLKDGADVHSKDPSKMSSPNIGIGFENQMKSPPKVVIPVTRVRVDEYLRYQSEEPFSTPLVQASQLDGQQIERSRGRLKRLSEEIVSPTSMPQSMRCLLN